MMEGISKQSLRWLYRLGVHHEIAAFPGRENTRASSIADATRCQKKQQGNGTVNVVGSGSG